MKLNNKYYTLRHGEALSNVKEMNSCWPEKFLNHLTKKGVAKIEESAQKLKNKNINYIFASDILRTKETAEIIGKELKIKPNFDKRLREQNVGIFNGQSVKVARDFFGPRGIGRFEKKPPKGERYIDIEKRMADFLKDINKRYNQKNILIISHESPLMFLEAWLAGVKNKYFYKKERWIGKKEWIGKGEFKDLN